MSGDYSANVPSLALSFAESAEQDVSGLVAWLASLDVDAAQRFFERLRLEAVSLCSQAEMPDTTGQFAMTIGGARRHEEASRHYSLSIYQHIFTTAKRRIRRNSGSTYRLFYGFLDTDDDGEIDTLRVYSVRHGAATLAWSTDTPPEVE